MILAELAEAMPVHQASSISSSESLRFALGCFSESLRF